MAHAAAAAAAPTTLPPDNAGYLEREYWDARFQREDEYEWFRGCAPPGGDGLRCAVADASTQV
jgi:hypothetical protein